MDMFASERKGKRGYAQGMLRTPGSCRKKQEKGEPHFTGNDRRQTRRHTGSRRRHAGASRGEEMGTTFANVRHPHYQRLIMPKQNYFSKSPSHYLHLGSSQHV